MERVQPVQQAAQGGEVVSLAPFPAAPLVSGLEQFELLLKQFLQGLHGASDTISQPARELGA